LWLGSWVDLPIRRLRDLGSARAAAWTGLRSPSSVGRAAGWAPCLRRRCPVAASAHGDRLQVGREPLSPGQVGREPLSRGRGLPPAAPARRATSTPAGARRVRFVRSGVVHRWGTREIYTMGAGQDQNPDGVHLAGIAGVDNSGVDLGVVWPVIDERSGRSQRPTGSGRPTPRGCRWAAGGPPFPAEPLLELRSPLEAPPEATARPARPARGAANQVEAPRRSVLRRTWTLRAPPRRQSPPSGSPPSGAPDQASTTSDPREAPQPAGRPADGSTGNGPPPEATGSRSPAVVPP
jgi:hypothetical protein